MDIRTEAQQLGFTIIERCPEPGDIYLAGKNCGPQLLTCKEVKDGYVVPVEEAYPFDIVNCVVVTV